eukprot:7173055-Pyramimonas_sp.AAC.1
MHWAMGQDWVQKATAEPQKQCKSPTQLSLHERPHCACEAYARFREKKKARRRSEAARPTEQGELKVAAGVVS